MKLNNLSRSKGYVRKKKTVGRGYGSGKGGHTSGRGSKGQKARGKVPVGFEGGQTPLYKRIPQIGGFNNPTRKKYVAIPLEKLNVFSNGAKITPENLVKGGIIKKITKNGVKILSNGNLKKKLTLSGFAVSKEAKRKIEEIGGKVL